MVHVTFSALRYIFYSFFNEREQDVERTFKTVMVIVLKAQIISNCNICILLPHYWF